MKVCAKSNIMMSLKYLKQLMKVYEERNQTDKQKELRMIINHLHKFYWEE